jgi:enoyl-CoA hydratase
MTETRLFTELRGSVAVARLDREAKLNAIDLPMLEAIEAWVAATERNRDVRAAILTGSGTRAFSTGGDIKAWAGMDPIAFGREWVREGHRVFDRLARLRQPLIAVLNGSAFGGGLELAACADFIVAESHVQLGLSETGLAMTPGWSGTQRLVRRFGSRNVKRLSLFGEIPGAERARDMGIVDLVVPTGDGLAAALALAETVAARGPVAVQVAKALINAAEGEESAAAVEALAGTLVAYTEDLKEGVAGFREKRPATFKDR